MGLRNGLSRRSVLGTGLAGGVSALALAACGETVVERVEVPVEVIKEVQVAGETVIKEVESIKEVEVAGETVIKEVEVEVVKEVEVIKEVEVQLEAARSGAAWAPVAGFAWPETIFDITEPTTLKTVHAWSAAFWPVQEEFDRKFMERHPNIEIKATNTPWGDLRQRLVVQGAAGTLPDIYYNHFSWAQQLIEAGVALPLGDYINAQPDFDMADFFTPSLQSYLKDGVLHGIPYDEGPIQLYYNADLFDAAGVALPDTGWTFDDMREAALKLTSGDGGDKVWGLDQISNFGTVDGPYKWAPWGGQITNEPLETESRLDEQGSLDAYNYWIGLRTVDKVVPSPAEMTDLTAVAGSFETGRVGMSMAGSWATPRIMANVKANWNLTHMPIGPIGERITASAGSCYSMSDTAENLEAAWVYMNEYLSKAGQTEVWGLSGRGSMARLSAWPAYLALPADKVPPNVQMVFEALNTFARHDILDSPVASEVASKAKETSDLAQIGEVSPADALEQIHSDITPILAKNK